MPEGTGTDLGVGEAGKAGTGTDSPPVTPSVSPPKVHESPGWIGWLVFVVLIATLVFCVYVIYEVFPGAECVAPSQHAGRHAGESWLDWFRCTLERRYFTLALFAGIGGACAYAIGSFAAHMAKKDFSRRWLTWYFVRPIVGGALALGFYFVVRAGFISPVSNGQVQTVNQPAQNDKPVKDPTQGTGNGKKPADTPADKADTKPSEPPAGPAGEKPVGGSSDKPAEKPAGGTEDKPAAADTSTVINATQSLNPYTLLAVSLLVGMFTTQATTRLKAVAEALFGKEAGKDGPPRAR